MKDSTFNASECCQLVLLYTYITRISSLSIINFYHSLRKYIVYKVYLNKHVFELTIFAGSIK